MGKKKVAILLITFVASTCAVVLLLGSLNWRKYYGLARDDVATDGLITAKEPANHLSLRYSFTVNKKTFSGIESVGNSLDTFNVGDTVRVYYLPTNPDVNCFCNPNTKLKEETITVLLAALGTSVVILIVLIRRILI